MTTIVTFLRREYSTRSSRYSQDSDSDSESENSSHQPKLIKRASNLLTRGKYKDNIPLKKRLYALVKCVIEYVVSNSKMR